MLSMGLRIGEVVQMNVDDIGPILSLQVTGGKGGRNRPVLVPPAVREAVAEYRRCVPASPKAGTGWRFFSGISTPGLHQSLRRS